MSRKSVWTLLKLALAAAIAAGVGLHFARVLQNPQLQNHPFTVRWELLPVAGLLYLMAHTLWGSFWVRLLNEQGVRVGWAAGVRAYFVSQFGKYLPGKVAVIVMRVEMLKALGTKRLPVAVTAAYETLTSMGAGAMIGALLLPFLGVVPVEVSGNVAFVVGVACLPLGVAVLQQLITRVAMRARGADAPAVPYPSVRLLTQGLLQTAVGWCLLGLSLGLVVRAVAPAPVPWDRPAYLAELAAVALSYVVGFVVLVAPGGLGAREYVLQVLLARRFEPDLGAAVADGQAVVVALVLRLVWTVAELLVAVPLWLMKPTRPAAGDPLEARG